MAYLAHAGNNLNLRALFDRFVVSPRGLKLFGPVASLTTPFSEIGTAGEDLVAPKHMLTTDYLVSCESDIPADAVGWRLPVLVI